MTKGPIKQLQTIMDPVDLGACAKLGQFGWAQMRNAQNDWVEGALTTAKALHTARLSFSNDADFGKWCEANKLGPAFINHNDRAALIRIGADLDYWRDRIAKSDSRSLPRIVANDIPPPDVSPTRIPARHQTKPGPKPAAKTAEAPSGDEVAEFERLVEEGRKVVAAKADTADAPRLWSSELPEDDPDYWRVQVMEYTDAREEAGLDMPENSFIIFNRAKAVAWFEAALAAYDEAHPAKPASDDTLH